MRHLVTIIALAATFAGTVATTASAHPKTRCPAHNVCTPPIKGPASERPRPTAHPSKRKGSNHPCPPRTACTPPIVRPTSPDRPVPTIVDPAPATRAVVLLPLLPERPSLARIR